MTVTDGEFFEEFKRLEKACGKLNGETHAVSRYIDDMRSVEEYGRARVDGYVADLKTLIYLRKLRNVLAHESKEGVCTARDTERLREFCGRVERGTDPLSLLKGIAEKEKAAETARAAKPSVRTYYPSDAAPDEEKSNVFSQAETFPDDAGSGDLSQSVRFSGEPSQNGGMPFPETRTEKKPFRKEFPPKADRAAATGKKRKADKSTVIVLLCVAALVAISFGALLIARVLQ